MASTRLPGKIFIKICGKSILKHVIERCKKAKINKIIIATSINKENDKIERFCKKNKILFFRGPEKNVLKRYYDCAKKYKLNTIIRITSDCPLIDPQIINRGLEQFKKKKVDYLSNVVCRSFPRGLDTEVFSFKALEKAYKNAKGKFQKEHVTPFIYHNPKRFKMESLIAKGNLNAPNLRLCVDTPEDLKLMRIIYKRFYKGKPINIKKVLSFLKANPAFIVINSRSEKQHLNKNIKEKVNQKFIKN